MTAPPLVIQSERAVLIHTHRSGTALFLGLLPSREDVRVNAQAWRDITDLGADDATYLCRVVHVSEPPGSFTFTPPPGMRRLFLWYAPAHGGGVTVMGLGGILMLPLVDATALGFRDLLSDGVIIVDALRLPRSSPGQFLAGADETGGP